MSFDSVKKNAAFAAKQKFPFPLLSDVDRKLAMSLGVVGSSGAFFAPRVTFVISADGVIEQSIDTQDAGAQASDLLLTF